MNDDDRLDRLLSDWSERTRDDAAAYALVKPIIRSPDYIPPATPTRMWDTRPWHRDPETWVKVAAAGVVVCVVAFAVVSWTADAAPPEDRRTSPIAASIHETLEERSSLSESSEER